MANIFEFLSKDENITPEKACKSRQMQFHVKTAYVWGLRYRWDPSLSLNPVRRFAHFMPPWAEMSKIISKQSLSQTMQCWNVYDSHSGPCWVETSSGAHEFPWHDFKGGHFQEFSRTNWTKCSFITSAPHSSNGKAGSLEPLSSTFCPSTLHCGELGHENVLQHPKGVCDQTKLVSLVISHAGIVIVALT